MTNDKLEDLVVPSWYALRKFWGAWDPNSRKMKLSNKF